MTRRQPAEWTVHQVSNPCYLQPGKNTGDFLEDIVTKRGNADEKIPQLGDVQLSAYEVVKFSSPVSWRLTKSDDADMEATYRIQGILCAFELPPVQSKKNLDTKKFFIRQGVRLTGLSTEAFGKAASACEEVYAKMATHLPDGTLNKWENTVYEGHIATDFNARYFTNRHDAQYEVNLPFSKGVDPEGVLERLRGQNLIHGPDNHVEYLTLVEDGSYENIPPGNFQIGDIVEVTVAFVILPVKDDRHILTAQLRALTLLNNETSQTSIHTARQIISCKNRGQLKRKALYATVEALEDTRGKLAKLQIKGAKGDKRNNHTD